jgi:hypothetical protein
MSVSILSPIMRVSSLRHLIFLIAWRIIRGLGLPMKYAFLSVASSIGDINALQAGTIPASDGPVTSGFVPMSFAPLSTKRVACSICS